MKLIAFLAAGALLVPVLIGIAHAAAVTGQAAPAFSLKDSAGAAHSLDALKGKWVVLEWVNFECPFVKKHYGSGNMQALQKAYAGKGVAWFTVNSSAHGKQGYYPAEQIAALVNERGAAPTAYLLDTDGTVGRAYGRQDDAAHVRHRPHGRSGLCGRDR